MENTKDYGWNTVDHPNSCDYLGEVILNKLNSIRPRSVLDLGCGNGALCGLMRSTFPEMKVVGMDYDKQGVQLAREQYPSVEFYNYGVQDDPAELLRKTDGLFDVVISTEVIEHLYAPKLLPSYANSVLKEGGLLIITTPYHGYMKNLMLSITNKWDSHIDPFWDGGHIKFWSKRTMERLLVESGFDVKEFVGIGRVRYLWKSMLMIGLKS